MSFGSACGSFRRRIHVLSPPPTESTRWFAEEVHPHEPSLRSYLHGSFPAVRDVDDVVQESFLRVWKARATHPIHSARAFLFQVARHLVRDLLRRERVSPLERTTELDSVAVPDEARDAAEVAAMQERIRLLADAIDALPARCRDVVVMRKLQGISQRDTAARLNLSEKTVESQLARGVKRCEEFLRRRGVRSYYGE